MNVVLPVPFWPSMTMISESVNSPASMSRLKSPVAGQGRTGGQECCAALERGQADAGARPAGRPELIVPSVFFIAGYLYLRCRSRSGFSSAVSAILNVSDISRNRMFSVGTKPSRKMLMPDTVRCHPEPRPTRIPGVQGHVRRPLRDAKRWVGGRTFAHAERERDHTVSTGDAVENADEVGQVVQDAEVVLDGDDVAERPCPLVVVCEDV